MSTLKKSIQKLAGETQGNLQKSLLALLKQGSIDGDFEDALQDAVDAVNRLKGAVRPLINPQIKSKCNEVKDLLEDIEDIWKKL